MYAKQNTAKTFLVGPILDADGAAKTDEVVASIKVTKNGTVGDPNASSTLTHDHTGHYVYAANAGDFDTLGEVEFSLNSGTNAMAPVRFMVVPANVYDAMVSGTDKLEVDATQWDGSTVPVFPANFASLGINASGHVSRVTLVDTCTQNSDMRGTDGAATPADLGDLQTHGDSNWATATGFSTLTTADIDARLAAWGKTGFSLSATTGWGGTALPTSFSANNLPSKYPATLAATDVSGALPANVVQWNSGALPSIGTSNLTAQQVWEYANRTLTSMGFPVNLTPEARSALVAAIEVELANDETGEALMQAIADKLAAEFNLDELTVIAIRDAILNRVLAGNHDIPGSVGSQLQYLNAPIDSRAPASTALSNVTWTDNRAALLDKLGVPGVLAHTGNADLFKATGFAVPGSAMTLTSGERNAVADAVLSRDVVNAEASAAEHSLCTIVLASLESSINGTTWTIKRTDGVTTHATKTLTTDETADPITGVS